MIQDVSESIENETKERKGGTLRILIHILGGNLLGNTLVGKGKMRAGERKLE